MYKNSSGNIKFHGLEKTLTNLIVNKSLFLVQAFLDAGGKTAQDWHRTQGQDIIEKYAPQRPDQSMLSLYYKNNAMADSIDKVQLDLDYEKGPHKAYFSPEPKPLLYFNINNLIRDFLHVTPLASQMYKTSLKRKLTQNFYGTVEHELTHVFRWAYQNENIGVSYGQQDLDSDEGKYFSDIEEQLAFARTIAREVYTEIETMFERNHVPFDDDEVAKKMAWDIELDDDFSWRKDYLPESKTYQRMLKYLDNKQKKNLLMRVYKEVKRLLLG